MTTFATMAYIIVVNPAILSAIPGFEAGPATVATILTAVFGCLLMGLAANRPIAVAPYMGENAFLAFGLAAFEITWQQRLGTVFIAGAAFLVLTLLGIRTWLAAAISPSMKQSFAVGIGLFLLLIGLHETGIVVNGQGPVPLQLGDLGDPRGPARHCRLRRHGFAARLAGQGGHLDRHHPGCTCRHRPRIWPGVQSGERPRPGTRNSI